MKPDLHRLAEQRQHERRARAYADSLFLLVKLRDGYELAALLGQAEVCDNRRAVYVWVREHINRPGADCSLAGMRQALLNQLSESCAE